MQREFGTILVTGGSGFIGRNFIRYLLDRKDFRGRIVNMDALTYAGDPESLADLSHLPGGARCFFVKADIRDRGAVESVFGTWRPDAVLHLAAESHVDRSIEGPEAFVQTNVVGTFNLLDAARRAWEDRKDSLFHHVTTDEVFGPAGPGERFGEGRPYDPRSPYSASKAASDHLVRAWHYTYGLPTTLSNSSNNYGPWQFPEKLIPRMITSMLEEKPLPIYGDGRNVRDWLHVEDHCAALWTIMRGGEDGRSYNVGGGNEVENIALVDRLMALVAEVTGRDIASLRRLLAFVPDRLGHDRRYAMDCGRLEKELGWKPKRDFGAGLRETVEWYIGHRAWWTGIGGR